MTNNYRRNHSLPMKRYCGYHKKRKKQKELESLKRYYAPRIKELVKKILSPKESWKRDLVDYLI